MGDETPIRNPEDLPLGEPLATLNEVAAHFRVARASALRLPLGWFKVGNQWRCRRSAVARHETTDTAA